MRTQDLAEMMEPSAVQDSIKYLSSQQGILETWDNKDILETFEHALDNNALIILLVNASHYIVVTGHTSESFIVFDPNFSTSIDVTKTIPFDELLGAWALKHEGILPNGHNLHLEEVIIVSRGN